MQKACDTIVRAVSRQKGLPWRGVILISAMRQGPAPRRVRELPNLFGVDRVTIARWQAFWRDHVRRTPFWRIACAHIVPVVEIVALPLSLVEAFECGNDPYHDWVGLLRFLSPLTRGNGTASEHWAAKEASVVRQALHKTRSGAGHRLQQGSGGDHDGIGAEPD
jgi:hypothetical protein